MSKIKDFIDNHADNTQRLHPASIEWRDLILICIAIKFLTACFSVFAGYHLIASKFSELGAVLSVAFGFMFVGLIEWANMGFMQKAIKMLLYKFWSSAVFLFFACLLLFSLSFFVSTEGLASWKQNAPREKVASSETDIRKSFDGRISALSSDIETIKRNTWKGKLDRSQENRIAKLTDNIETLQREKIIAIDSEQKRVSDAKQKIESVIVHQASEFYFIASIIMIFQFVGNLLLGFFLFIVFRENEGIENQLEIVAQSYGQRLEFFVLKNLEHKQRKIINLLDRAEKKNTNTLLSIEGQTVETETEQDEPQSKKTTDSDASGLQPEMQKEVKGNPERTVIGGFFGIKKNLITAADQHANAPVNTPPLEVQKTTTKTAVNEQAQSSLGRGLSQKTCPTCGKVFMQKSWNQIYCNSDGKNTCKYDAFSQKTGKPISVVFGKSKKGK